MRRWFRGAVVGSALALGALAGALIARPSGVAAQGTPYKAPRTVDGKADLSGFWQAISTANWDLEDHPPRPGLPQLGVFGVTPPAQGVVEGGTIPYQPWALAKKRENFAKRWTEDPEAKCYLPGVPRATYLPYLFQIIQGMNQIVIVYGMADANRTIHLDKVMPPPVDTWMGRSHGRFEGDTLVVDVTGLNGQAWLDRAGNFVSDNAHIIERYTPITPYHLQYEATIDDGTVFTRPWKISMPLYRRMEPNVQMLEFKCTEFAEELLYGHLRK